MSDSESSFSDTEIYEGEPIARIDLVDDPKHQGHVHELGHEIYADETSGYSLSVRELNALHGKGIFFNRATGKEEASSASLLIYRIKSINETDNQERRIQNVIARMKFRAAFKNSKPADDPFISSYAPAEKDIIGMMKTDVLRTKHRDRKIGLDIDANPAPVVASGELGDGREWEWHKDVWATVAGSEHKSPGRGRLGLDVVQWTMNENRFSKHYMDRIDVAVLLRRPNDKPFMIEFPKVEMKVDWRYATARTAGDAADGMRSLFGSKEYKEDASADEENRTYNPVIQGKMPKLPDGVTASTLHLLKEDDVMDTFAFLHMLGEERGVQPMPNEHLKDFGVKKAEDGSEQS